MAWRSLPAQRTARCRGGRSRRAGRKLTAIMAVAAMVTSLATPAVAQTDPPARPTGLRLSAPSSNSVRLDWRNPGDRSITGYEISRRLGDSESASGVIVENTGSRATSYVDPTVDDATAYYYSIKALNLNGSSEASNELYVRVPPETDRSPVVTGNTAVIYTETENGTKTVVSYRAKVSDSSQPTWTLSGTDGDKFTIRDGVLAFNSYPDYEDPTDEGTSSGDNDYEVTITASGGSLSGNLAVVVTVTNVDEPPTLMQTSPVVDEDAEKRTDIDNYLENRSATDVVATYSAADPEGEEISWSLSGADRDDFTIDDGMLSFAASPDFEAPTDSNRNNVYTVTVVASDGAKTASWSVNVTVKSVDEPGTVTLSSPQPVVGVTLTATLADPDVRLTDIVWQWQANSQNIVGANSATYRPDEEDINAILTVRVEYTDSHGRKRRGDALTTTTERVMDSPPEKNLRPVFDSLSFTREVEENTDPGQAVGVPVVATDGDDSLLTYSLSGTDAAVFTIDSSGQIKTRAALDYEAKRTYRVNVVATDPSNASRSVVVTINVTDVEEPLSRVTGDTMVDYAENRTDAVAAYSATDPDGTPITWEISGDDYGEFDISNRGVLSFERRPDYEDPADQGGNNTYEVTVEASSGDDDRPLSVTVMVTDIDEPLTLTGDTSVRYAEKSSDTVHTYVAADPDAADHPVMWTLEGADRELFTITGGDLKFKASRDYENPTDRGRNGSYDVTVVAFHKKDTGRQNVTVTVTDENEDGENNGLVFSSDQPQAGTALTATLTDPDALRSISWQWQTSPNGADPWLNATGRGARSATYTPTSADGVNIRYLRVSVTYTDPFGRKALGPSRIANRVRAKPSMNTAPVFSSTDENRDVGENTPSGEAIGAPLSAADDDDSDDTLSYSLRGRDAAAFTINRSSRQISTRAALDYEAKDSYEVTVRATDLSAAFDDVPVTITVGNVEEDGTVTLSGGPPKVGTKLTARLTDPDGDIYGLTWQWQRSKNRASGWTDIFAATSETYTPTGAHTDYYLRAVADYKDGFAPNTPETADGTTLEIVERVQQQQRDTSTGTGTDTDDRRPTSSGTSSGTSRGSGTSGTQRPDPEPEPDDDKAFSDIDDTSSLHRALRTLSSEGVLDRTGCGRGRLCPEDHLLRWEMAVWLVRVVDDGTDPRPTRRSRFADVDADEWWSAHVERLADLGITEGCKTEPLSYCPDQPVTRAQMASFLVRAFKLPRAGSAGFEDTAGNVHARNIDAIYAAEITIGCASIPLMYCPGRYTTRAQMARFLLRGR